MLQEFFKSYPLKVFSIFSIYLFSYATAYIIYYSQLNNNPQNLNQFSSLYKPPQVLGVSVTRIEASDARAAAIDKVFAKYNCPITGTGTTFVQEADKNNIPYWLVASIAFQESSCGKNTPKAAGKESNNLWGYGVWGKHVKTFDTVEQGISAVSVYLNKRFFSQGITEPCDIMKVYTPPSKGSWCRGVKFFGEMMQENHK